MGTEFDPRDLPRFKAKCTYECEGDGEFNAGPFNTWRLTDCELVETDEWGWRKSPGDPKTIFFFSGPMPFEHWTGLVFDPEVVPNPAIGCSEDPSFPEHNYPLTLDTTPLPNQIICPKTFPTFDFEEDDEPFVGARLPFPCCGDEHLDNSMNERFGIDGEGGTEGVACEFQGGNLPFVPEIIRGECACFEDPNDSVHGISSDGVFSLQNRHQEFFRSAFWAASESCLTECKDTVDMDIEECSSRPSLDTTLETLLEELRLLQALANQYAILLGNTPSTIAIPSGGFFIDKAELTGDKLEDVFREIELIFNDIFDTESLPVIYLTDDPLSAQEPPIDEIHVNCDFNEPEISPLEFPWPCWWFWSERGAGGFIPPGEIANAAGKYNWRERDPMFVGREGLYDLRQFTTGGAGFPHHPCMDTNDVMDLSGGVAPDFRPDTNRLCLGFRNFEIYFEISRCLRLGECGPNDFLCVRPPHTYKRMCPHNDCPSDKADGPDYKFASGHFRTGTTINFQNSCQSQAHCAGDSIVSSREDSCTNACNDCDDAPDCFDDCFDACIIQAEFECEGCCDNFCGGGAADPVCGGGTVTINRSEWIECFETAFSDDTIDLAPGLNGICEPYQVKLSTGFLPGTGGGTVPLGTSSSARWVVIARRLGDSATTGLGPTDACSVPPNSLCNPGVGDKFYAVLSARINPPDGRDPLDEVPEEVCQTDGSGNLIGIPVTAAEICAEPDTSACNVVKIIIS